MTHEEARNLAHKAGLNALNNMSPEECLRLGIHHPANTGQQPSKAWAGIDFGTDPATMTFIEERTPFTSKDYERMKESVRRKGSRLSPRVLGPDDVEAVLKDQPQLPGGEG